MFMLARVLSRQKWNPCIISLMGYTQIVINLYPNCILVSQLNYSLKWSINSLLFGKLLPRFLLPHSPQTLPPLFSPIQPPWQQTPPPSLLPIFLLTQMQNPFSQPSPAPTKPQTLQINIKTP